jgi:outer membrane immunogenic protein
MTRFLWSAVALLTLFVVAPVRTAKALPVAPPPFSWTGFYVGLDGGGAVGTNDYYSSFVPSWSIPPFAAGSGSYQVGGIFGGPVAGFNYQFSNNVVLGIEANAALTTLGGNYGGCIPSGFACLHNEFDLNDFGTVRGRVGYEVSWNNALIYGTGGLAWGHSIFSSTYETLTPTSVTAFSSADRWGWAAGAGVEIPLSANWSMNLQYLHIQFNSTDTSLPLGGFRAINTVFAVAPSRIVGNFSSSTGFETLSGGFNYRFNTWGQLGPIWTP